MSGRLGRYKDFAWFVGKYGRADFVTKAVAGDDTAASDPAAAEAFARDLESLGPTFIKLGQILWPCAGGAHRRRRDAHARADDNHDFRLSGDCDAAVPDGGRRWILDGLDDPGGRRPEDPYALSLRADWRPVGDEVSPADFFRDHFDSAEHGRHVERRVQRSAQDPFAPHRGGQDGERERRTDPRQHTRQLGHDDQRSNVCACCPIDAPQPARPGEY